MKKGVILFVLLLLSLQLVQAERGSTPDIKLTLISQEPDPAEPGETVKLKFKIENNGSETKQDVIIEPLPEYPLSIYKGQIKRNLGKLRADQNGADAIIVEYTFKIDEGAAGVEEEFDTQVKIEGTYTIFEDLPIRIVSRDSIVAITDVFFDKQQIAPGQPFQLGLETTNFANTLTNSIKVKLDLSETPIASKESTEQRLVQLKPGESEPLIFKLITDSDAEPSLYKIPITLTYQDNRGNQTTRQDEIGIVITAPPEIILYARETNIIQRKKPNTLTLEVVNKGLGKIKFLDIKINETKDYKLLSAPYTYIGDIDSDDTDSLEAQIFTNKKGEIKIPVTLTYTDSSNTKHKQLETLQLQTFAEQDFIKYGLKSRNLTQVIIITLIALAAAGYYIYKKRRKNE